MLTVSDLSVKFAAAGGMAIQVGPLKESVDEVAGPGAQFEY